MVVWRPGRAWAAAPGSRDPGRGVMAEYGASWFFLDAQPALAAEIERYGLGDLLDVHDAARVSSTECSGSATMPPRSISRLPARRACSTMPSRGIAGALDTDEGSTTSPTSTCPCRPGSRRSDRRRRRPPSSTRSPPRWAAGNRIGSRCSACWSTPSRAATGSTTSWVGPARASPRAHPASPRRSGRTQRPTCDCRARWCASVSTPAGSRSTSPAARCVPSRRSWRSAPCVGRRVVRSSAAGGEAPRGDLWARRRLHEGPRDRRRRARGFLGLGWRPTCRASSAGPRCPAAGW